MEGGGGCDQVGGGQWGALEELQHLDLNGNCFGDVGVLRLAMCLSFHARLRSLSVSHTLPRHGPRLNINPVFDSFVGTNEANTSWFCLGAGEGPKTGSIIKILL